MSIPSVKDLMESVEPAGIAGVYIMPREALARAPRPFRINDSPITAIRPHPDADDLVYVTTGPPAMLDFLPD